MQKININLAKIIDLLNDGQYHDGTSVGHQLNITRAAVWKVIKKLNEYGVAINSIKGKGYRLEQPLILLNERKIKKQLKTSKIQLDILEKVDSTNDYLKKYSQQNKIVACIAETQVKGKGRLNRTWYSPFGQNIYLSLLIPFQKDISELAGLSLIAGLAVRYAIAKTGAIEKPIHVKWPNDIIVDKHKIAGIMIELQAEANGFCSAIIGIGINVNMQEANKNQINQPWSSLQRDTSRYYDRNQLCAELIDQLVLYLEKFMALGLKHFIDEWQQHDVLYHQSVKVVSNNTIYRGLCNGINQVGHLLLQSDDGQELIFSAGDTSLVKG